MTNGKLSKKEICIFNKNKICTNCLNHQRDYLEKPIDTCELIGKPTGYRLIAGFNILEGSQDNG
jgi:hypothetical protein